MNTQPDDDLDTTAELPVLNPQLAEQALGAGASHHGQLDHTGWQAPDAASLDRYDDPTGSWELADELVSVHDKMVSLETSLAESDARHARLHALHESL